ncbi:MAG: pilus assembly protein TadG-related protein [Nocardioides sp.]
MSRVRIRWQKRRFDQKGYVAILVATLIPTVFMVCAAFAVDTTNWYAQQRDVQKAADAAALAGVPFLPNDMPSATTKAQDVAARNGYTDGVNATVTVTTGARPTQLKVTITTTVPNTFGRVVGSPTATISETAVADYQGPQPMGSPCNTFGNEPSQGTANSLTTSTGSALGTTPLPNCSSNPQLWATIQGPTVTKDWGDRYQSINCTSSATDGCTGTKNDEYASEGYFWVVKVAAAAVGQPITLQLYDPAYVFTGSDCGSISASGMTNNPNPYVTSDGKARYAASVTTSPTGATYCTGDHPSGTTNNQPMITSFALRGQTDTQDPMKGALMTSCIKQFGSQTTAPATADLTSSNKNYDQSLASEFHNWVDLCTFTPTRAGDFYLQVRDNVSTSGGTPVANTNSNPTLIWTGNTAAGAATGNLNTGYGDNSFGIRALIANGYQTSVSVSGYDRMPIYATGDTTVETFNLIRVLPGAAGSYINFSVFDLGDGLGSKTGTVRVVVPSDATGTIKTTPFPGNCSAVGGYAGAGQTLTACTATISGTKNNATTESLTIPIPSDYNCSYTVASGCWYQVVVSFSSGVTVSDITTWDATVEGDPVRLVQ